jgi:hypothetical protein
MEKRSMMPFRFVGRVTPANPEKDDGVIAPGILWYLDPLPNDADNTLDIRIGQNLDDQWWDIHQMVNRKIRELRSIASMWLTSTIHSSGLPLFSSAPATNIAYGWLWDDLRKLHWTGRSSKPYPSS